MVLITQNQPADDEIREAMRDYLHSYNYQRKRVQFAYMFQEKQKDFMQAIAEGKQPDDGSTAHQVVIIWRRDTSNIKYEWLKDGWMIEPDKVNLLCIPLPFRTVAMLNLRQSKVSLLPWELVNIAKYVLEKNMLLTEFISMAHNCVSFQGIVYICSDVNVFYRPS